LRKGCGGLRFACEVTDYSLVIWLRALLLHPAVFVAPPALLSYWTATRAGSQLEDVDQYVVWILVTPVGSFLLTLFAISRSRLSSREKLAATGLGFLGSVGVAFLGLLLWWHTAVIACHDLYECPI
jgi:hypothetical protein